MTQIIGSSRMRSRVAREKLICGVVSQNSPLIFSTLYPGGWPHKALKVIIVGFLGLCCQHRISSIQTRDEDFRNMSDKRFAGKVALVTGATSGIGQACA